jgi:hypothetical protein
MGLDVSHDCWHGAYSAFHRFRMELAKAAGIPLPLMEGYQAREGHNFEYVTNPALKYWLDLVLHYLPIKWDHFRDDPLTILLDHSDGDGWIDRRDEIPLAKRLEELAPLLDSVESGGHLGNVGHAARTFAAGLRRAHEAKQRVEFR